MSLENKVDEKLTSAQLQDNCSTSQLSTSNPSETDQLEENESTLIMLLSYWLPKSSKAFENTPVPKTREELVEFINKIFESFKREEQECWSQLSNLHLMTPQMLHLYQKKFIQVQSMNWIQLLCYKAISCPNGKDCRSYREQKMLNNQFYDFELECPYFHNNKDKRRIVLPLKPDEEFRYKGKYQEQTNSEDPGESLFSHNYFESVYHPLFYKFFDCKRLQCKGSIYCPMKHSEDERVSWEEEFSLCWRKDRSIYYPKKKKNSNDFTEYGSDEKQYSQGKPMRYNNNYNQRFNTHHHNSQPYQHNQYNNSYNGNSNRGKFQGKPFYPKEYRYNGSKNQYDQQQQGYPQMYGQGMESPFESKTQNAFASYSNTPQYMNGDLNTVNLKLKHNNSTPTDYEAVEGSFNTFGGYGQYNQGFDFGNSNGTLYKSMSNGNNNQKSPLYSNEDNYGQFASGSKKTYMGSPIGLGYQDSEDDGDLDFESIFSSNSQYSQSFTASEGYGKKQLKPSGSKAFYPESGAKSGQTNRIEVK